MISPEGSATLTSVRRTQCSLKEPKKIWCSVLSGSLDPPVPERCVRKPYLRHCYLISK